MLRALPIALLLALIFSAPASAAGATTRVTGDWGGWADIAGRFDVPLPDAYVHSGGCPEWSGEAATLPCSSMETIEVWVPDDTDRFALAHELGHQFDIQYLTDAAREWLRRVMRAPGGAWHKPYGANEWFADFYADCAVGLGHSSLEAYAKRPTPARLRRVCTAIRVWGLTR